MPTPRGYDLCGTHVVSFPATRKFEKSRKLYLSHENRMSYSRC